MRDCSAVEDTADALEALVAAALKSWRLQAHEIRLVKRRENAVFRVVDTRGAAYALRVHHPGNHSDEAILSEMQWIRALQDSGIEVPGIVPTAEGELVASVALDETLPRRQVALFDWIDGRPLGTSEGGLGNDLQDIERVYRTVGAIMARTHEHTSRWALPQGFERPSWDFAGLVGEQPLWGRFWDLPALSPDERSLLLAAREVVRQELAAMSTAADGSQPYGLIHADFVPENLLLMRSGQVRLIDFDDSGFGWHLFDIATALYFLQLDQSFGTAQASLLAGYRAHRPLPQALLDKLPVFMMARGFTYLGWVHTRPGSSDGQAITPHLIRLACRQARILLA